MTPELLTRLRSWLSADESQYECRLSVNEVREIVGALEAKDADITRLSTALERLVTRHADLVESGDCGFWDVETEPEMIEARAALDALDGPTPEDGIRGEKPQGPESGQ